jgi:predicted nucleotidyltransferase
MKRTPIKNYPNLLKKIVSDISTNKRVLGIYLFGSQAKNKTTPLSDIDICVLASNLNDEEKASLLGNSSRKVDVVLFEDLPFNVRWKVFREGKELYLKDKEAVESIKWRTFKDYQDFKPIIKRQMEDLLPGVAYV